MAASSHGHAGTPQGGVIRAFPVRSEPGRDEAAEGEDAERQEGVLEAAGVGLRQDHVAEIVQGARVEHRLGDFADDQVYYDGFRVARTL